MVDYDNMSNEELEKAFLEAKNQELNSMKGEQDNGLLQGQEEEINESSLNTNPPLEGDTLTNTDEIEFEKTENVNNIEEPTQGANDEVVPPESISNNQTYKIKANGKEYEMTLDELKQTASKGMDYVRKTTALKPYRTMISAMEQNNISPEDINLLIDLKKGNKDAIHKLIKDNEIDPYELPEEVEYKPTEYRLSEEQLEVKEIVDELSKEEEFSRTSQIYKSMDNASKIAFSQNPQMIRLLHNDVKSGYFDKLLPIAEKQAMIDGYGKPFLEYYALAGQIYNASLPNMPQIQGQQPTIPTNQQKAYTPPENRQAKMAAGLPSQRVDKKTATDYLDEEISDEDYYAWRAKIQREY